jgi:hypothetical protein
VEINNINLEYFIDYINRRVHILDLEPFGDRLLNSISPEFMRKFISAENLLIDILEFDWLCYATSGVIFSYKNYNVQFAHSETALIHQPFIEKIKKRGKNFDGQ